MLGLFVTQKQASVLKDLGFKESCFGYYVDLELKLVTLTAGLNDPHSPIISAPLKSQAIQFLLKKLGPYVNINIFDDESGSWLFFLLKDIKFNSLEEAIDLGIAELQRRNNAKSKLL